MTKISAQNNRATKIQYALKETKKGKFISQEAMENWVDSLGNKGELSYPKPDVFHKPPSSYLQDLDEAVESINTRPTYDAEEVFSWIKTWGNDAKKPFAEDVKPQYKNKK